MLMMRRELSVQCRVRKVERLFVARCFSACLARHRGRTDATLAAGCLERAGAAEEPLASARAVLLLEVLPEIVAPLRRGGVEEEGQPVHGQLDVRLLGSFLQVSLADEAPRSDLPPQSVSIAGRSSTCLKLPSQSMPHQMLFGLDFFARCGLRKQHTFLRPPIAPFRLGLRKPARRDPRQSIRAPRGMPTSHGKELELLIPLKKTLHYSKTGHENYTHRLHKLV